MVEETEDPNKTTDLSQVTDKIVKIESGQEGVSQKYSGILDPGTRNILQALCQIREV